MKGHFERNTNKEDQVPRLTSHNYPLWLKFCTLTFTDKVLDRSENHDRIYKIKNIYHWN